MTPEANSDREFQENISRRMAKATLICVLVVIASIFRALVSELTDTKLVIMGGGILSIACLFTYLIAIAVMIPLRGRSFLTSSLLLTGLVPWAYAVYLTVYEGIWNFFSHFEVLNIWLVARSVFFVVTGATLAKFIDSLTRYSKSNRSPDG